MFKKLLVISLLTGAIGLLASGVQSDNGKAGKTGSPNELTCHDCHDDFTQGSGGGSVALTSSNMPGWEYVPGTTYHMTCTVSRATMPLFGLGVECLTSTNANAGTLTITDATHTTIKTATVSGVSRRNVVHKLDGGVATGSKAFTFDWVAPATNIGNVKFYFAGVAANADGDEAVGDYVYVGNQTVTPATSTGMIEQEVGMSFSVYPNPAHETMSVSYELPAAGNVDCALYDLQGHRVRQMIMAQRQPGKHVEMIDGLGNLAAGNYLLISDLNGTRQTRMVMLQP